MDLRRSIAISIVASLIVGLVPTSARAASDDGRPATVVVPASTPAVTSPTLNLRASAMRAVVAEVARDKFDNSDKTGTLEDQSSTSAPQARTSKARRDDAAMAGGGGGGTGAMVMTLVSLLVSVGVAYYFITQMKKNQQTAGD